MDLTIGLLNRRSYGNEASGNTHRQELSSIATRTYNTWQTCESVVGSSITGFWVLYVFTGCDHCQHCHSKHSKWSEYRSYHSHLGIKCLQSRVCDITGHNGPLRRPIWP